MGPNRYNIVPIVEGHGEVDAVPILLDRWFKHRKYLNFQTSKYVVRAPKSAIVASLDEERELGIELYIRRALMQSKKPDGILVLIDADDECIARRGRPHEQQLGPELLARALSEASHIPIGVVVADREFEAWYLAAHMRLKQLGFFDPEVRFRAGFDFARPRDCKGQVGRCVGHKYSETADQKKIATLISFRSYMCKHCPSFAKLIRDLERITQQARRNRRAQLRQSRKTQMASEGA